jgi:two-component system OmpR family response regulator/two-component system copper resistance phosphate regulon response regulator CusR
MRILVVEDQPKIAGFIRSGLEEAFFAVTVARTGEEGYELATTESFDAMILDIMLPGEDGLTVLKAARAGGVRTPVIVLTARGLVSEKLQAFEAGADDYLVKPFAMDELLARIEAVHRRAADKPAMTLAAGRLHLSLANRRATLDDRPVDLTPTEFNILELLMRFQGQVVTRKMLCEHVWGFDWDGPTNVIEVHINRLRGKIDKGRDASMIQTIRGRGYALATD